MHFEIAADAANKIWHIKKEVLKKLGEIIFYFLTAISFLLVRDKNESLSWGYILQGLMFWREIKDIFNIPEFI